MDQTSNVLTGLVHNLQRVQQQLGKYWQQSKFFRIISIATGSCSLFLCARIVYLRSYRGYLNLPPGLYGLPLLGQTLNIMDSVWLQRVSSYGCMTSIMLGPYHGLLINEPQLARQLYTNARAVDIIVANEKFANYSFATANGKVWSDRRKIIYANLMTTMTGSYVEHATKRFVQNKLFPEIAKDIQDGRATELKSLLRPLGFNIVLHACFGKELVSLQDPLWLQFDAQQSANNANAVVQMIIEMIFGQTAFSNMVQRAFTGCDLLQGFNALSDILERLSQSQQHNVAADDDMRKTFDDYVADYVASSDAKYTRRDLLNDMAVMFFAATDTTYSSISYALLLSAKYPSLQQELYEEISHAFGSDVSRIEFGNQGLVKLPKLRAFILETLRIFPPLPVTGFRQILKPGLVVDARPFGGRKFEVPVGTMPLINAAAINFNPKYWIKNYDAQFDADINMREVHLNFWLDTDGKFDKKQNSKNFYAFHVGKRDCVGQALAMKELIIVLAMTFMQYKVLPHNGSTDAEIKSHFTGAVVEPVDTKVLFQPRIST
mmetsp:Transcript_34143/g.55655  ORF Transcript_34143/g.55655 Transcript_34143/m.55655 type:complete len:547 (-) Transcript_34143:41-1681(-)